MQADRRRFPLRAARAVVPVKPRRHPSSMRATRRKPWRAGSGDASAVSTGTPGRDAPVEHVCGHDEEHAGEDPIEDTPARRESSRETRTTQAAEGAAADETQR